MYKILAMFGINKQSRRKMMGVGKRSGFLLQIESSELFYTAIRCLVTATKGQLLLRRQK
jgi:hypothetical protein